MGYLLVVVMSSAYFLPSSQTYTSFESREACEQALVEAKTHWQTVNHESKCVDLANEAKKIELQKQLKEIK